VPEICTFAGARAIQLPFARETATDQVAIAIEQDVGEANT
jgi:hypothetical protein